MAHFDGLDRCRLAVAPVQGVHTGDARVHGARTDLGVQLTACGETYGNACSVLCLSGGVTRAAGADQVCDREKVELLHALLTIDGPEDVEGRNGFRSLFEDDPSAGEEHFYCRFRDPVLAFCKAHRCRLFLYHLPLYGRVPQDRSLDGLVEAAEGCCFAELLNINIDVLLEDAVHDIHIVHVHNNHYELFEPRPLPRHHVGGDPVKVMHVVPARILPIKVIPAAAPPELADMDDQLLRLQLYEVDLLIAHELQQQEVAVAGRA
jgi:hypothetical protein